ncbi:MAG TPA: hypothetical protein VGB79_04550 [Allosphingosinicella sp.]
MADEASGIGLRDILSARGLRDDTPSEYSSHLRVCLYNIKVAVELGHVSRVTVQDLFRELLDGLLAAGWANNGAHVDQVYLQLAVILARADPGRFFCRPTEVESYLNAEAVSLQPSWAFKFWLNDDVHDARSEEHQYADVVALIMAFVEHENRRPGARIGAPLLWIAPCVGAVRDVVARALQSQYDGGAQLLERGGYAQRLRDLLGLERRYFPEHAIAAVTGVTIGELKGDSGGLSTHDEVTPDAEMQRLAAPTQLDAGDYPVFRHWPTSEREFDADYGRTWDLASEAGRGRWSGAPELVSDPLPIDLVSRMVPLGQIRTQSPSEHDKLLFAARFANEVCGAETIEGLIECLAGTVEV